MRYYLDCRFCNTPVRLHRRDYIRHVDAEPPTLPLCRDCYRCRGGAVDWSQADAEIFARESGGGDGDSSV